MNNYKNASAVSRIYSYVLSIGGTLGLLAMTWQASERVHMLKNPEVSLSCSINPIIDCSGVLGNHLAAVLGFPNAFLGMIFFAILATSGLLLLSGGTFTSWYRHFVMAVSVILILFSIWFFGVSLYILGKICIFCVVGWVVSVPIFWYGLLVYLQSANDKIKKKTQRFTQFGQRHHIDVVVFIYLVMLALFFVQFRTYYIN